MSTGTCFSLHPVFIEICSSANETASIKINKNNNDNNKIMKWINSLINDNVETTC